MPQQTELANESLKPSGRPAKNSTRHGLHETHGPRYGTNIVGGVKLKADPKTGRVTAAESGKQ